MLAATISAVGFWTVPRHADIPT